MARARNVSGRMKKSASGWRRVAVAQLRQRRTSSTYSNSRMWTKSSKASLLVLGIFPRMLAALTRRSWHRPSLAIGPGLPAQDGTKSCEWASLSAVALLCSLALSSQRPSEQCMYTVLILFLHLCIAVNHCRYVASLGGCSSIFHISARLASFPGAGGVARKYPGNEATARYAILFGLIWALLHALPLPACSYALLPSIIIIMFSQ